MYDAPHFNNLFLDNSWEPALDTCPTEDPKTGQTLHLLPEADADQVHRAVQCAGEVPEAPVSDRIHWLLDLANYIAELKELLAQLDAIDMGKTLADAREDVDEAVALFRYYASLLQRRPAQTTVPTDLRGHEATVVRQPYGCVALITAWNFPLAIVAAKLAMALAAGNAVIIKPSEHASLSTMQLTRAFHDLLPHGQVQVLTGGGSTGRALANHPGVRLVSFTGSAATGQRILEACSRTLATPILELGGKNSAVVLADANVAEALPHLVQGFCANGGQVCVCTTRLLVHRTHYDAVVQALAARLRDAPPVLLACTPQTERVQRLLHRTLQQEGVHVVCGGLDTDLPPNRVRPTVLAHARGTPCWDEEVFGPVACVEPFDTVAEAIALANDTPYGLSAAVFGATPRPVSLRLHAGIVYENQTLAASIQTPLCGWKASGIGREYGPAGLHAFQQVKTITAKLR